ncbi:hypothetical protein G7046_g3093 [Stylonectria norvegica]|nr:hypothetical protein G7046_g3093 [Stylonectria norvegica]
MVASSVKAAAIVLCGIREDIGEIVIEGLKPEYNVVHFIMNPKAGAEDIPEILRGNIPKSSATNIGSRDFSMGIRAVVVGGAFTQDGLTEMQEAAAKVSDTVWLRQDKTKAAPPLGPLYAEAMVTRTKETLNRLQAEGKLEGSEGGTYLY